MTPLAATVSPDWLALREPADHAARAPGLLEAIRAVLPRGAIVVHDLGSGTGSMSRWLAPQLPGPQQWVLHDRDERLLARAVQASPLLAADGTPVRITPRVNDVTALTPGDLAGCSLVTASALLDLLTADEVTRIATSCVEAGAAALFTLSVIGEVILTPRRRLDDVIAVAFNDHQRRTLSTRRLLGPAAVGHTVEAFTRLGARVTVRDSRWTLGAADTDLVVEWLVGWVRAACDQRPNLVPHARPFLRHRLAEAAAGRLRVTVGHADLLAVPAGTASNHAPRTNVYRLEGGDSVRG